MGRARRMWVLVALLAVAGATPAGAQTAAEQAEIENQQGKELFGAGRYVESAARFQRAFDLNPLSKYLYNLGYAWLNTGTEPQKALDAFDKFVPLCKEEGKGICADQERVEKEMVRLKDLAYRALPLVTMQSDPAGATIYFMEEGASQERIIGQTPFATNLAEGRYYLRLVLDGYEPFSAPFEVKRQGDLTLSFPLARIKNIGHLRVRTNVKGARIFLDGKPFGISPYEEVVDVEAGKHQIVVEKDAYTTFNEPVDVATGAEVDVSATIFLKDAPASWRAYVGWPTAVIGLLGVGAGITFWQLADKEFAGTPTFNDYELYQNLGYGLGGGLLAVGTGLIIWEYVRTDVASEDRIDIAPVFSVDPGSGMVFGAMGSF
ncbi:MAG: hypothetical protein AMXMBFR64_28910 [Myxococcales bacterium]